MMSYLQTGGRRGLEFTVLNMILDYIRDTICKKYSTKHVDIKTCARHVHRAKHHMDMR